MCIRDRVRAALEELAATLACRNVTPERIEELKMANKRFEAAIISKDVVAIVDADVNFHDIIYAMTDNQRLIQIINNLREQMYRYRLEYVKDARAHSILISEHKDIIDKLSKKDEENTKIVIRQQDVYKRQIICIMFIYICGNLLNNPVIHIYFLNNIFLIILTADNKQQKFN